MRAVHNMHVNMCTCACARFAYKHALYMGILLLHVRGSTAVRGPRTCLLLQQNPQSAGVRRPGRLCAEENGHVIECLYGDTLYTSEKELGEDSEGGGWPHAHTTIVTLVV